MKIVIVIVIGLLQMGCQSISIDPILKVARLKDTYQYKRQAPWRILPSTPVAAVITRSKETPKNRAELIKLSMGQWAYPRTVNQLEMSLMSELSERFSRYDYIKPSTLHEAQLKAAIHGYPVLIEARIIYVSDAHHLSERSWFDSDAVAIRFYIYETHTQKLIDTMSLEAKSAFFKAENVLALDLIDKGVSQLFEYLTPTES